MNTIFEKCDKRDEQGKKVEGGDGLLTGKERESFMRKIKRKMPEIYGKVVEFFVTVDVIEDLRKEQSIQASLRDLQEMHENNRQELQNMQKQKKIQNWMKKAQKQLGEQQQKSLDELEKIEQEFDIEKEQLELKRQLEQE